MTIFLIRTASSQLSSYPIILTKLGGPHSRSNPHFKIVKVSGIEPRPLGQQSDTLTPRPVIYGSQIWITNEEGTPQATHMSEEKITKHSYHVHRSNEG